MKLIPPSKAVRSAGSGKMIDKEILQFNKVIVSCMVIHLGTYYSTSWWSQEFSCISYDEEKNQSANLYKPKGDYLCVFLPSHTCHVNNDSLSHVILIVNKFRRVINRFWLVKFRWVVMCFLGHAKEHSKNTKWRKRNYLFHRQFYVIWQA